jgi:hypothetical protein
MHKLKIALLGLLLIALAGCSTNATLTTPFDPQEASFIKQAGTSTISGQGFLRTMVGEVRYAAGSEVFLIPATKYSTERIGQIYGNSKCALFGKNFKNDDPSYREFTKSTKANGEGRFQFSGLSAGEYFVVTSVYWQIPGRYIPEGCGIYEFVKIASGENKEVIVSGN